jgi:hypothetical protein
VTTAVVGETGCADGGSGVARFGSILGVVQDPEGNTYVADSTFNAIRKVALDGTVTTIAGDGVGGGLTDGPAKAARFLTPHGLARNATTGDLYVVDWGNHAIRKITPAGQISSLAARFTNLPTAVAIGNDGAVYVAVSDECAVYKIVGDGAPTLLAGGTCGYANGSTNAAFGKDIRSIAVNANDDVFVADRYNNTIRYIDRYGRVNTVAGVPPTNETDAGESRDGNFTNARFARPMSLTLDREGNLYVSEASRSIVRKISFDFGQVSSGQVSTLDKVSKSAELTNDASTLGALSVQGSRLVFARGFHLEQIDFAP